MGTAQGKVRRIGGCPFTPKRKMPQPFYGWGIFRQIGIARLMGGLVVAAYRYLSALERPFSGFERLGEIEDLLVGLTL